MLTRMEYIMKGIMNIFSCFSSRMIFTVLCGLLFGSDGYYVALAWSSCALMFFIVSISCCVLKFI